MKKNETCSFVSSTKRNNQYAEEMKRNEETENVNPT